LRAISHEPAPRSAYEMERNSGLNEWRGAFDRKNSTIDDIEQVRLSDRFGGSLAGVISSQGGGIRLGSVGTRWARRNGCGTRTAEGVPRRFANQPSEPRRPCALQPCSTPCSESRSLSSRRWSSPRRAWSATSSRRNRPANCIWQESGSDRYQSRS